MTGKKLYYLVKIMILKTMITTSIMIRKIRMRVSVIDMAIIIEVEKVARMMVF